LPSRFHVTAEQIVRFPGARAFTQGRSSSRCSKKAGYTAEESAAAAYRLAEAFAADEDAAA
jgi:hypothetical protein